MAAGWLNITLSIVVFAALIALGYVVLNPIYVLKPVLYTCNTVLPTIYTKQTERSITIYHVNPGRPDRIVFVPGGGFLRCCLDFTPFLTTNLRGYELYFLEYQPLTKSLDIAATIADLGRIMRRLLDPGAGVETTTVIGYSAGAYLGLKALELVDFAPARTVDFIGVHGYYGVSTSAVLEFYNWLYLPSFIKLRGSLDVHLITGDDDPLQNSTYEFYSKYRVETPLRVVPGGTHYTFYDANRNQLYLDGIAEIVAARKRRPK